MNTNRDTKLKNRNKKIMHNTKLVSVNGNFLKLFKGDFMKALLLGKYYFECECNKFEPTQCTLELFVQRYYFNREDVLNTKNWLKENGFIVLHKENDREYVCINRDYINELIYRETA